MSADINPAPFGAPRAVSADDRARIAPTGHTDAPDWYDTTGWDHRDDAHRVTFEGEGA